jgi:hypothetical protein
MRGPSWKYVAQMSTGGPPDMRPWTGPSHLPCPARSLHAQKAPAEDVPIWVRREQMRELEAKEGKKDLPWAFYLLASSMTAIAAVGCIFEFVGQNAFFGLIQPDSPLWAPILLTLAVTGLPTAGECPPSKL